MGFILGLFFFLLGTAIGSFLNVVILRYNTGLSFSTGRSQCFSCGKTLEWHELVPLFSFIILRGKCSKCKSRISWQYPLVEALTGFVFLGIFWKYYSLVSVAFPVFLLAAVSSFFVASLLIVIVVYDMRHKIIPDGLVFSIIGISFIRLFISLPPAIQRGGLFDILAGPLLALPFAFLWFASGGRWMGLGDAKLTLGLGWLIGLAGGISALILSFWIGAAVSLGLLLAQKSGLSFRGKRLTMKSEIPFAPFLVIGFGLVYFFGLNIVDLSAFIGPSIGSL